MDEDKAEATAEALDTLAVAASPEEDLVESAEAFLIKVSAALKASDKVDADLAAVLSDHLLTVTPHANVIAKVKAAILLLAAERAASTEEHARG